ncbi:MAG TPA: oligopeptide/dipeptide ABC transporter ATP-binding protein [Acidimicrobiales bacterium]|nr:oligopeptide/dipeptide ABC transporter ATP-binding protein [Acidimicrobiales bacterium]
MSLPLNKNPISNSPSEHLLEVRDLVVEFAVRQRSGIKGAKVQAVSGLTFEIAPGETLGVVGETGCGKSTMARAVMQAERPKSGEVIFEGEDLTKLSNRELQDVRKHLQIIFQDPFSSVDPRWRVKNIVEEPLIIHQTGTPGERASRVAELLDLVGLDINIHGNRRPRELSGGQCQRVAIARALALSPRLMVCDEAVSSLDVSIQAQILNLLIRLRQELGLSYLFIAHDLAVVKYLSDRVAVMYLGKFCEIGPAESLYRQPLHPYTSALLDAIPNTDGRQSRHHDELGVEAPSPINPPSGCRYRTRCPRAEEKCALEEPRMRFLAPGHGVACHFPNASDTVQLSD